MSSYVVEYKTIDRIITGLAIYYTNFILEDWGFEDNNDLGRFLLGMNIDAVDLRYNETNDRKCVDDYVYIYQPSLSRVQFVKSLACFLYQCFEGNVPSRDLYIELERIKNVVAYDIVVNMPMYDEAEWA